jgi:hypothetical protein
MGLEIAREDAARVCLEISEGRAAVVEVMELARELVHAIEDLVPTGQEPHAQALATAALLITSFSVNYGGARLHRPGAVGRA